MENALTTILFLAFGLSVYGFLKPHIVYFLLYRRNVSRQLEKK